MNFYPWQQTLWQQWSQGAAHLPHAILLYGQAGIGKAQFAQHWAQSLLCEARDAQGHACGQCASCAWFVQRNHPDVRILRPEALEVLEGYSDDSQEAKASEDQAEKKIKRAPSKEIKIEQIRALHRLLEVSSHRGGRRIVVLYPAQAMNLYTGNALLKMLEEPPPDTIFILVTHNVSEVLPTIASRCQKFLMPTPPYAQSLAWLEEQGIEAAELWLAEYGGAPLAAYLAAQQPDGQQISMQKKLLHALAQPQRLDPSMLAEALSKIEMTVVVQWLQRWLFDCISQKLARRIRYYPAHVQAISELIDSIDARAMLAFSKILNQERRSVEHPLNAKLFFENLLIHYQCRFSGAADSNSRYDRG